MTAGGERPDRAGSPACDQRQPPNQTPDRIARLALGHVIEPGDAVLGGLVVEHGAVAVLEALTAGNLPDLLSGDGTGRSRDALGRRQPVLTARLLRADIEADLRVAADTGAHFVAPGEFGWPTQLDDLAQRRPLGLWLRGSVELRHAAIRSVALVGARRSSPYGQDVAGSLAADLAAAGWLVVSGAAYGIDAAAHRGSLAARGPTAAVLACGIDQCYPRGHDRLVEAIAETGVVVAELAPGTTPNRFRFIERNRLIAALTRGTAVVEAALRSGALNTARQAEQLGRCVMGVPGPVTTGCSDGVHQLIRDGAVLVTDAAEIIEHVGDLGADLAPLLRGERRPHDALDPVARRVLESLPRAGGTSVLGIARDTALDPASVHAALGRLAAHGWASQTDAGWCLIARTGARAP